MTRTSYGVLIALLLCACSLAAQSTPDQPKCPDADTPEFQRFNGEFVFALQHRDPAALSFLVSFPLRVNTARGTIQIPDAESLAGHFDQIFTPATIKDILSTGNNIGCRYDMGISYGRGSAWVSDSDTVTKQDNRPLIALYVVNVVDDSSLPFPRLTYTCSAARHRIVIDQVASDRFRYRSWDAPKQLSSSPDLEVSNGKQTFDGTGVCAVPSYTFTKGNVQYIVSRGLGCTDGKEPKDATGELNVSIGDKGISHAWCF